MYKITDFKKGCPVCQALSKSLTKTKCDFCKAKLVEMTNEYASRYSGSGDELSWTFKTKG